MIRMVARMIRVSGVRMIRAAVRMIRLCRSSRGWPDVRVSVRMIREGPDGPGVGPDDPAWGFTYGCLRGSYPGRPGLRPDRPG